MSFRTFHFDGVGPRTQLPGVVDGRATCARPTRSIGGCSNCFSGTARRNLWHLKTPVHMFALDALVEAYPDAKFLWSHRDPAKVLGSVCSLIQYVRSWSSDRR